MEGMTMTNLNWEKYSLIADLSERLNGVSPQFGKTVLQKMIFILQEVYGVPCGYKFSLYSYGPYCSEIPKDLDFVTALCGTEVCRISGGFGGYEIIPGEHCKEIKGFGADFLKKYEDKINQAVSDFGFYNARDLELRSTIVYCCKEMNDKSDGVDFEDIVSSVYEIKPKFSIEEIRNTVGALIEKNVCHLN
jgi:uncharacterized protein YwgA